ncbi:MAG: hypothetical protein DMG07_05615 [Acidobacteria bacterium]|nr:MAG: hypothetical protein DMG07_05615 [Acidobacteriota bacterium]
MSSKLQDKDVPWPYNDFLFEIDRGDVSLSCAIAPAYRDVRLILKRGSDKLYELNATGVEDVKYEDRNGVEILEIILSAREQIRLKVKPRIEINHRANTEP